MYITSCIRLTILNFNRLTRVAVRNIRVKIVYYCCLFFALPTNAQSILTEYFEHKYYYDKFDLAVAFFNTSISGRDEVSNVYMALFSQLDLMDDRRVSVLESLYRSEHHLSYLELLKQSAAMQDNSRWLKFTSELHDELYSLELDRTLSGYFPAYHYSGMYDDYKSLLAYGPPLIDQLNRQSMKVVNFLRAKFDWEYYLLDASPDIVKNLGYADFKSVIKVVAPGYDFRVSIEKRTAAYIEAASKTREMLRKRRANAYPAPDIPYSFSISGSTFNFISVVPSSARSIVDNEMRKYNETMKRLQELPRDEFGLGLGFPDDVVSSGNFAESLYSIECENDYDNYVLSHTNGTGKVFWIASTETTRNQWFSVMGGEPNIDYYVKNQGLPGEFDYLLANENLPITYVSWLEAVRFCDLLTRKARREAALPPGFYFRLPYLIEWKDAFNQALSHEPAAPLNHLGGALTVSQRNGETFMLQPVGRNLQDSLGIHDLNGNAGEWLADFELPGAASNVVRLNFIGGPQFDVDINLSMPQITIVPASNVSAADGNVRISYTGFRVVLIDENTNSIYKKTKAHLD